MKLARAAIFALILTALAVGNAYSEQKGKEQQGQTIKAALLYNGTGLMASIDEPAYRGAMLAAKLINAKGGISIGDKLIPFELIPTDTASDITRATSAALDERNKDVAAVIGYSDGAFVMSAASPFVDKGIPYISPGATLPSLPQTLGDRFYMTAYGDDAQGRAMADYTYNNLNIKKVVVWTDTSMAFTLALSNSFKQWFRELGGVVLYEDIFKSGQPTPPGIPAMVEQLKTHELQPDALFIAAIDEQAALAVKLLTNAGVTIPILSGDGFDTPLVEKAETSKPINGLYFSTHSFREDKRKEVTDFIEAYKKEYGSPPANAYAALGFDAVNLLADAVGRADLADKDAISKALSETKGFKAVTGAITMKPFAPPEKSIAIAEIKDGKFTVVHTWNP
ncbi:MAG: ABC transporter substrate-binding protein [Candidatus Magnetominusculus sp. LBB02]|nr:ABC transporter substrate-binding protein [Candidatus Magnetominusculus sp. LBB02]